MTNRTSPLVAAAAPVVAIVALLAAPAATAQEDQKVERSVEIVAPEPEQALRGATEVRVVVRPSDFRPAYVLAALGGPPWLPLAPRGDGVWVGEIDTTLVPNLSTQLHVRAWSGKLREKVVAAVVPCRPDNPYRCFFGDLHSHTYISDGKLTPQEAHRFAREEAGLDFFCLTDHLESVTPREWRHTREIAWKANEDGAFVAFPGLEWTKKIGHLNVYDPGTHVWPKGLDDFYEMAGRLGVIAKINHPASEDGFGDLRWTPARDRIVTMMEVRSEKEEEWYIRALDAGWHLAAEGSDDTHHNDWGRHGTWTGIWAPGLSRENILHALRTHCCYSTRDRNCQLDFRLGGAVMGSVLEKPRQEVSVTVEIDDPDAEERIVKLELFADGKVVRSVEPGERKVSWQATLPVAPGKHYYFVKATQADGQKLWSAPIWIEPTEPGK